MKRIDVERAHIMTSARQRDECAWLHKNSLFLFTDITFVIPCRETGQVVC